MTLELGPPPRPRLRVALGAVVVIVIVGLVAAVIAGMLSPHGTVLAIADAGARTSPSGVTIDSVGAAAGVLAAEGDVLLVHVLGAVERPGLYRLGRAARVIDGIAAAGGLTVDADPGGVNLARPLADAEQLVVPRKGEAPAVPGGAAAPQPGIAANGRVDLNRADASLLETLPRIGPATAARIIRWRDEHGGFAAVEDLLAISGIGEKTLESLRDLVTV